MAEDIVRTGIEINIDTANAVSQLRALEQQISQFNARIVSSNDAMRTALSANTKILQQQIGDIGQFTTQIRTMQTTVGQFSTALEKGKMSFGEYFRYGLASTKTFGRAFGKELEIINATAEDRVKRLSTRMIALGREANGMQRVLAIRPEVLPEGMDTQLALAAQKQQIFNQLLRQGSTHLLNWGKNTQWAGRQLMVGFTIPLTIFGGIAAQVFMDLERQAINFRRVYGDAFTPAGETDAMLEQVKQLSTEFTKYGIAASETMDMAAKAAATGAQGADLIAATTEATRLATLGQIDQQQALDATIALQSAFALNATELAQAVDFLNAVENQTVVSLNDVTQAIPRAATVVQGLGGDVRDLSAFLAAMRENGVNAAEGANALKSGLASLINPTKQAREQLEAVGIDIKTIIETNRGDLMGTVQAFATAVNALDPLTRQQTLAQVFGKYQFARLGALFENITKDGSQASRVLQLMGDDVSNLAALSAKELGVIEDAVGVKFQGAVERLRIAIAPIGELFLKIATPIIEAVTKVAEAFNNLPSGVKTAVAAVVGVLGGIAPVLLMGVGLIGNGVANLIKFFDVMRNAYLRMTGKVTGATGPLTQAFGFMTDAELDAAAAAGTLDASLDGLRATALLNMDAIEGLTGSYRRFAGAMNEASAARPQGVMAPPVISRGRVRAMASGGFVGGTGNKDSEPALLMPGEFVVTADAAKQFAPILVAMNQGNLKGYADGTPAENVRRIGRFVPEPTSPENFQSARATYEFGHAAGFAADELKNTITSLSETSDRVRSLGDRATEADTAFLDLLDTVLDSQKTFVKMEEAADGSWRATDVATKSLKDLSLEAESAASLGQFAGGKITSGTRNEALKQINVDEPISFADLTIAAQAAEQKLLAVANGAAEMQMPYQYALQAVIDEYNDLRGDLQAQSRYLLDNAQAMIRDGLMTDQKMSAEDALRVSLQKRQEIEEMLVRTGAMLNGEIIDTARAQQVVEAMLLRQADALAISSNPQIARRTAMSASSASKIGKIAQPRQEGSTAKVFATPATRTAVAQELQGSGVDIANDFQRYFIPSLEDGVTAGIQAASPPPWSIQLGGWIADGIIDGAQSQSSRFATAYPSMPIARMQPDPNIAANMQSLRYAEATPKIFPFEVNPEISKNLEEMGLSSAKAAVASEKDAIATSTEATAHIENTAATNAEANQKKKGVGGFGKFLFAMDGLSLAMSFLPGPVGEIANKAFIASAALSALGAFIKIDLIKGALSRFSAALIAASGVQIASGAAKGGAAALGAAGDIATTAALLGGAKGKGISGLVTRFGASLQKVIRPVVTAGKVFFGLASRVGAFAIKLLSFGRIIVSVGSKLAGFTGIGLIITAVVGLFEVLGGVKKYADIGNQLKELGSAAKLAAEELASIGERFGFTARTTGFANQGTVLGRTEEARTVAQEARAFVSEDEAMQQRVGVVSGATDQQAEAVFRSLFMDLVASGAPREVAIGIVEAVALEAGKQKVFVPVQAELQASFDDKGQIKDLGAFIKENLTPSVNTLQTALDNLGNQGFNQAFSQEAVDDARRWFAITDSLPEVIKKSVIPQYEQKKAIFETAESFELLKNNSQTAMNLLSAEFVNGKITLDQFNQGMNQIYTSLASLPNNQGLQIIKDQLITLYPQSEATITSINDAKIAFDLLSLAAQGVNMSGFIQEMQSAGLSVDEVRAKLNALMAAQAAVSSAEADIARIEGELAAEKAKPGPEKPKKDGAGGGTKDPFAGREDEIRDEQARITIKEIKLDRTAEDRFDAELAQRFGDTSITVSGIEMPLDSIQNTEFALEAINEEIEDIERGPLQAFQDRIDGINEEIGVYQDQLEVINRDIELQEQAIRRIEEEYRPILNSLEEQKSAQEDILRSLEDQRDAAIRPYEDQIAILEKQLRVAEQAAKPRLDALENEEKALDTQTDALDDQINFIEEQKDALGAVAKMNERIARQQKNRLNLTQALAEGDIYAATAAAQEMRQEAVSQAAEEQQNAFDAQQKSLEDQKKLIDDRRDAIEKERDAIQAGLEAIQDQIEAQEYQKFLIEDSYRISLQAANDSIAATDREIARQTALRDARIKPFQDIIDNYAPQIDTINNNIYAKEQEIKKIQADMKPYEDRITYLTRQKDLLDDIKGDVAAEIEKDKAAFARRKQYLDQELAILSARREIADIGQGGGGGTGGTEGTRDPERIKQLEAELAAAKARKAAAEENLPEPAVVEETGMFDGVIAGAQTAWTNFTTWFGKNVIEPIKSAWNSITTWFDTNVIQPIKNIWDRFGDDIIAIKDTFFALFVAIVEIFSSILIQNLTKLWNGFYSLVIQPTIDKFTSAWELAKTAFGLALTGMQIAWNFLWNTFIKPRLDILETVWNVVSSAASTAFNAIGEVFSNIWKAVFQDKIDAFLTLFGKVKDSFVEKFNEIGTWWDEWKRLTFDQKVEAMKNGLKSLFDPDTWHDWMASAVNAIIRVWNGLELKLGPVDDNPISQFFGIAGKSLTLGTRDIDEIPYKKRYMGGLIKRAMGGPIAGNGSRDSVPTMLTPGEFVVRKSMVDKYGPSMLNSINQGSFTMPQYARQPLGGLQQMSMPRYKIDRSTQGNISVKTESTSNVVSPMYNNYSVSVNVSNTNASADEIANKTIMKIKQMQNMQIRGNRGY